MARLDPIVCRLCGKLILSDQFTPDDLGAASHAESYDSCLRRCPECKVGYSNARNPEHVVAIHRDFRNNVPREVRDGLDEALDSTLNLRNRENKRTKFGFESSEDAVTWTVFQHARQSGALGDVVRTIAPEWPPLTAHGPTMLLWGAPAGDIDGRASALRERLLSYLPTLHENPESLSEPDVVLDCGEAGLILIEVKYRSPNDSKDPLYGGWPRYVGSPCFLSTEEIRKSGQYELARFWRIGWDLAGDRPFALVNLGPASLFTGLEGRRLEAFRSALNAGSHRRFVRLTWTALVSVVRSRPEWFVGYLSKRIGGEGGARDMEGDRS